MYVDILINQLTVLPILIPMIFAANLIERYLSSVEILQ